MTKQIVHSVQTTSLADILERVLDKGVVIVGDIKIEIADVELLTIKIRLLIASVERAKEIGINWWEGEAFLKSSEFKGMKEENKRLKARLARLERGLA